MQFTDVRAGIELSHYYACIYRCAGRRLFWVTRGLRVQKFRISVRNVSAFVANMLTIMQPTLWWFNFVGVLGHKRSEHPHGETLLTIVRRTVTILVMLVNPYPQTVYLFANLDNIIEAAFSIYFVVVGVGMLVQLCVLMRNRVAVRQLVDHIEAIVNESEWTDLSRSL